MTPNEELADEAYEAGAFCPETASIFADGFETGDLSRWGGAS